MLSAPVLFRFRCAASRTDPSSRVVQLLEICVCIKGVDVYAVGDPLPHGESGPLGIVVLPMDPIELLAELADL
jgi:hypothetical protein